MAVVGDVLANEPIYYGLVTSLITYIVVSLATPAYLRAGAAVDWPGTTA